MLNSHCEFARTASIDDSSAVLSAGGFAPISGMPFSPPLPFGVPLGRALQSLFLCPTLPQWKHFMSLSIAFLSGLPLTTSLPLPFDARLRQSLFLWPYLPQYPHSSFYPKVCLRFFDLPFSTGA